MRHGIISSTYFTIGNIDFWIDLQDNSYFGERKAYYYVPSYRIEDCWNIDFTRQFKTEQACVKYITKCVKQTCKNILKELL